MPRLLFRLFAWTAILVFAVGAKLHLPFVQTTGWIGMTAAYATAMPLDEALVHAVSGRELCVVCEYVRDAEHLKSTGEAIVMKAMAHTDLPPISGESAIRLPDATLAPMADALARATDRFAPTRAERPETPPPRAA